MAFDLFSELTALLGSLEEEQIEYALCGGLAMAVHGYPRATVDIDLLVLADDVDRALAAAEALGYSSRAEAMSFAGGAIEIRRVSKVDPDTGDPIPLDFLVVTPAIDAVWTGRQKLKWEAGNLWVTSREGLIALKELRGSKQDLADIERLMESDSG